MTTASLLSPLAAPRAWMRLPSGQHLDLINPDPNSWLDSDLSLRLSRTFRWGGESCWPSPLSVAQHSLMVWALRMHWAQGTLSVAEQLAELLHDAEEGFLGFDCISPLKTVLGDPFKQVSDTLMGAIRSRYALPVLTGSHYLVHKQADVIIAASEAVHCIGWSAQEVREVLGIHHAVLVDDPLTELFDCPPWEPWPSAVARERFFSTLCDLLSQ